MKRRSVASLTLMIGASLAVAPGVAAQERGAGAESNANPLAGTSWRLLEIQSMNDAVGTARPSDPSLYTMELREDGTVTMRLDCNRATGTWAVEPGPDGEGGRFRFGPLAVTRALCPPGSLGEQISSQAEYFRSYLLKDGNLYLSLMADGGIYAWESDTASAPKAPDEGGPRAWEVFGVTSRLNLREQPSTAAAIAGGFAPGTILDNLGCQRTGREIWCDVQEMGGGPRGFVALRYLRPAVSPDGSISTGPDDSAMRAGEGDFDATGEIPCAQAPGQPMGSCPFGVARAGGGYATVVVRRPGGRPRAIFFRMGRPVGADGSEADGYPEFSAAKEGDLHVIRVGNERYEIPEAAVLGG